MARWWGNIFFAVLAGLIACAPAYVELQVEQSVSYPRGATPTGAVQTRHSLYLFTSAEDPQLAPAMQRSTDLALKGRFAEATDHLDAGAGSNTEDCRVLSNRGTLHFLAGSRSSGLELASRACHLCKSPEPVCSNLATMLEVGGEP